MKTFLACQLYILSLIQGDDVNAHNKQIFSQITTPIKKKKICRRKKLSLRMKTISAYQLYTLLLIQGRGVNAQDKQRPTQITTLIKKVCRHVKT